MSILIWILARCMATALLGVQVLLTFGSSGAQAHLLTPPMAAALVQVCGGQPCLAKLPEATPRPPGQAGKSGKSGKSSKSSNRLTRRST